MQSFGGDIAVHRVFSRYINLLSQSKSNSKTGQLIYFYLIRLPAKLTKIPWRWTSHLILRNLFIPWLIGNISYILYLISNYCEKYNK